MFDCIFKKSDIPADKAFREAAKNGEVKKMKKLLKEFPDIDINATTNGGYTALMLAVEKANLDVVKVLINDGRIFIQKGSQYHDANRGILHMALQLMHLSEKKKVKKHDEIIKCLLNNAYIDIYSIDSNGYTPLFIASRMNYIEITKMILNRYIKNNIKCLDEKTIYHIKKMAYSPEVLKLFEEYFPETIVKKDHIN